MRELGFLLLGFALGGLFEMMMSHHPHPLDSDTIIDTLVIVALVCMVIALFLIVVIIARVIVP